MKIRQTLALLGAAAGLAAIVTPAMASAAAPSQAKAYGRYCQAESKTHVAGTPGTPFSTCVKDMAKAAKSASSNPHRVCLNESKAHVAHMKGTPYSQCVSGAERLLKDMANKTS